MVRRTLNAVTCFLIVLFSSCQIQNPRFFNSPSTHTPAYLEKKGDHKISAGISVLPESEYSTYPSVTLLPIPTGTRKSRTHGFNVSGSYAFTDWLMATIGGEYRKERDAFSNNDVLQTYSTSQIDYTRKALDVGVGVIFPIDDSRVFFFNPVIGSNIGRFTSFFTNTSDTVNDDRIFHFHGNFQKFYLKPNLSFHFHKNFKMSFVSQLSLMRYGNTNDNYPENSHKLLGVDKLRSANMFLLEPATFFQIGTNNWDWLKFDLGLVFSIYPKGSETSERLRTRNFQFSAGFSIYP